MKERCLARWHEIEHGLLQRAGVVAEFIKPQMWIGRQSVLRQRAGFQQKTFGRIETGFVAGIALFHAQRTVQSNQRHAVPHRRRQNFAARRLQQQRQHQRKAGHAEEHERAIAPAPNGRADVPINSHGKNQQQQAQQPDHRQGQNRIKNEAPVGSHADFLRMKY